MLSMTTAALRLKLENWLKTRSDLGPLSSAMATRPPEATSPSPVGDLPSPPIASVQMMRSETEPTLLSPISDAPFPAVAANGVEPPRPQPASQSTVGDLAPPVVGAIAKTSTAPELPAAIDTITIAKRPHKTPIPETTATGEASDLASSTAAAARAKTLVERSVGIPNARILEPIVVRGADDGNSVNHRKRRRYETEVVVEIPRGSGSPIQRRYRLTLQYVGDGEWQLKGMQFATRC